MVYVILTSKTGLFKTELSEGLTAIQTYDYFWFGQKKARFVIAQIEGTPKIRIVDDEPPHLVNCIPSKLVQKFDTVDAALEELQSLANFSSSDIRLEKVSGAPAVSSRADGMLSVTFVSNAGKVAVAPVDSNLLRVSLREQGGIPFKCGGGVCGTCKCHIDEGLQNTDEIKPKERRHLSEEEFREGYRMACQTFLKGDVSVSWQPRPKTTNVPAARQASSAC